MIKKILVICLVLTTILSLVACGDSQETKPTPTTEEDSRIEINLNDYLTIRVTGHNGEGVAKVVGWDALEEDLMQKLGKGTTTTDIDTIKSAITCEIDTKYGLSNGDTVTVIFTVDKDIEDGYDIRIICEPITITVSDCPVISTAPAVA